MSIIYKFFNQSQYLYLTYYQDQLYRSCKWSKYKTFILDFSAVQCNYFFWQNTFNYIAFQHQSVLSTNLVWKLSLNILTQGHNDPCSIIIIMTITYCHMFTRLYGLETDKGDLHRKDGSQTVHLKKCSIVQFKFCYEQTKSKLWFEVI